ncbi:MAG TPA: anhydro-N-acetylmuramic acid kinase, partial [Candidatus Eremiobacteraceae bacterium]|nr:anhydro-N-acetylmuramic acid kinase [Candidatus Eremiobacteraceae bacterium]
MRVIGLMSGTSMDAIDAAVVDVERAGEELRVVTRAFVTMPYPAQTQAALESLLAAAQSGASDQTHFLSALASLNFAIGEAFGAAANLARNECPDAVLIGSHGQTVCHQPRPDGRSALSSSTLQLGEAAIIAERTGLTTIADFRVADIAAGGGGAPLVSYIDYVLLRSPDESRVALNIGGIANVTLLPAGCRASQVQAFDTGPGNMPIDLAARLLFADGPGFDRNGQIAAQGTIDENLLALLLADEYFSR